MEDADGDAEENLFYIKHEMMRHSHMRYLHMAVPFAVNFSFGQRKEIKRE